MFAMIAARARNGVIGLGGGLPWRLRSDMRRFRELTDGSTVVMGRRTWDSLPRRPLPGRLCLVATGDPGAREAVVREGGNHVPFVGIAFRAWSGLPEGLPNVWVIGGSSLYEAALSHVREIHLTEVDCEPPGDAFFPRLDEARWTEVASERRAPRRRRRPRHHLPRPEAARLTPWLNEGDSDLATTRDEAINTLKAALGSLRNLRFRTVGAAEDAAAALEAPIPMVLMCPACGVQHVDHPDEATGWTDPPHRSHLCGACGTTWRPADVATRGVRSISTAGADDSWSPPRCRTPPPGWECSREAGHPGPCATTPASWRTGPVVWMFPSRDAALREGFSGARMARGVEVAWWPERGLAPLRGLSPHKIVVAAGCIDWAYGGGPVGLLIEALWYMSWRMPADGGIVWG